MWGEIYLVVVDNRPDSVNYQKWESYIISERNHLSVLVPPNFLNGHLCLSDECLFHYTQSYPEEYVDWQEQDTLKELIMKLQVKTLITQKNFLQ